MNERYGAVLDVYALVATYPDEADALRTTTQYVALAYLREKAEKEELALLLRLAADLGYITQDLLDAHCRFLV